MSKHLLIAIATSKYEHLKPQDQRPRLVSVLGSVVDLFTVTLGRYTRELAAIAQNPPAADLAKALDTWFAAPERDPSDWIVVYYTGHAEVDGRLYLLTSDFLPFHYESSAFELTRLARMIANKRGRLEARRAQNVLFIVDSCFAGAGAPEFMSQLEDMFRRASEGQFYMIGAALPREEATAGALAEALIAAIDDLSKRNVTQEFLFLEQVVPAVNRRLVAHHALWSAASAATEEPKFFPNPSFVYTGGMPVSANESQRAIVDREFRDHWGPRSRGVEFDSQPGWYFSGRAAVLDELSTYLKDRKDSSTRVVTGGPGAGKSAILSRVVTLSIPEYREQAVRDPYTGDIPGVDLAIHANGKTFSDMVDRFAGALQTDSTPGAIIERLSKSKKPVRIVVDALDEAAEPAMIVEALLRPLSAVESVKLVVGTREKYARALGTDAIIDIDSDEYVNKADISGYVEARLLRAEPRASPYAGKAQLAHRVAQLVAAKAYPNFLTARLVSEDLISRPNVIDLESASDIAFAESYDVAFNNYLKRFAADEQKVRDLLVPLAYSEGPGLPWDNIWAPLASALSGRSYDDDHVRWLLEHAGSFILESAADGRSVYRLYHEALASFVRRGRDAFLIQKTFVRVLLASVPRRGEEDALDWPLASRYVRSYLAWHAAKCDMLAGIADPAYLLAADPSRLLSVIAAYREQLPGDVVGAYKSVVNHIRTKPAAEAASYLELVARQTGLHSFADEVARLPFARPWHVPWARWSPRPRTEAFADGGGRIFALQAADWGPDRPVALVGREDGSVEVWSIADGVKLLHWKPDAAETAIHVDLAQTSAGPMLVAAWNTGQVGAYDLTTGRSVVRAQRHGYKSAVRASCVVERNDGPVWVTADGEFRLALWNLPNLNLLLERDNATEAQVYFLCPVLYDGRLRVLGGSDSHVTESNENAESVLHIWSADDLSTIWEDRRRARGALTNGDTGVFFGQRLVVTSQGNLGPPEIWDLRGPRLVFRGDHDTSQSWLHEVGSETYLVSVSKYGDAAVAHRLLRNGEGPDYSLSSELLSASITVEGAYFTRVIRVNGRAVLLSSVFDQVRVWDLDELIAEAKRGPRRDLQDFRVYSMVADGRRGPVYVAWQATIFALDAATGDVLWDMSLPGAVNMYVAISPDATKLALGTDGGVIHVLNTDSPAAPVHSIAAGSLIRVLRIVEWQSRVIVFATVKTGGTWAVRAYDLGTRSEIPTHDAYQLRNGEEARMLGGLAVSKVGELVRFAFSSRYQKLMFADFTGETAPPPSIFGRLKELYTKHYFERPEVYIGPLGAGDEAGHAYLAAATDQGRLTIWDFVTEEMMHDRDDAHLGEVTAMTFVRLAGRTLLATGGVDGAVRLWTLGLEKVLDLSFGERVYDIAFVGGNALAIGGYNGLISIEVDERLLEEACTSSP